MLDFKGIEEKWQARWKDASAFKVEDLDYSKPKYYITTPYPYMSGLLHLGHLFTYSGPETVARFKRMQGHNVLFKFAFHCTGTPIVAAANKVKEGEEGQISTLKKMGIADSEIPKFADPEYWCEYFPEETKTDLSKMGFSIDERYMFRTTSLNPPYDALVRWHYNRLKEKGYVNKGRHPVVWCPKDGLPVGDHDRSEGEGEGLKDFIWVKFRLKDSDLILMTGTTRPDALLGQSNLWVDPHATYHIVKVGDEKWVVGKAAIQKIKDQLGECEEVGTIEAKEFIGKWVKGPVVDYELYILPAWFIDANVGSGLVYSALEDPVDLFELKKIQSTPEIIEEFGLDKAVVEKLGPISIIEVEGMSDNLGEDIGKEFKITSADQVQKLEDAKGELNRRVFRKGLMKDNCLKYSGMTVPKCQEAIKKDLINGNDGVMFYELTARVVCRCLTECIIKTVSDQWFVQYDDEEWKKKTHECLNGMTLYPEKVRKQFEYVIDWLNHWACTREFGLGTKLPWDEKWVIESLSDSALDQYLFCTISKYLMRPEEYGFSVDKLNDEFFDYVFYGKGEVDSVSSSTGIAVDMIEQMKKDFEYWYPLDYRNSAKDLIQNHLTFTLFQHTAMFDKDLWPKAYSLNGRIMVDNEKMSKSKGNFFTMRELYEKYSADLIRITAANAGEGIDDANYDMGFIETAGKKLAELASFIDEHYDKGRDTMLTIDKWFESSIHEVIRKATHCYENMLFKSAVQAAFMDMHRNVKWYMKRTGGGPREDLINLCIESQVKLLAPIIPHFCEEMWEKIDGEGFVSLTSWPVAEESKIDESLDKAEQLVINTSSDIREVLKLAKIENPQKATLFVSENWKYEFFSFIRENIEMDQKELIGAVMKDERFKKQGQSIMKFLPKMLQSRRIPEVSLSQEEEFVALNEAVDFMSSELGLELNIIKAEDSSEQKAKQAMPGKVAIVVE